MVSTDTPADYYRRKQQEVDELIAKIMDHLANHGGCDKSCIELRDLEKALERARYVGD